jgi:hypothetical protein
MSVACLKTSFNLALIKSLDCREENTSSLSFQHAIHVYINKPQVRHLNALISVLAVAEQVAC